MALGDTSRTITYLGQTSIATTYTCCMCQAQNTTPLGTASINQTVGVVLYQRDVCRSCGTPHLVSVHCGIADSTVQQVGEPQS